MVRGNGFREPFFFTNTIPHVVSDSPNIQVSNVSVTINDSTIGLGIRVQDSFSGNHYVIMRVLNSLGQIMTNIQFQLPFNTTGVYQFNNVIGNPISTEGNYTLFFIIFNDVGTSSETWQTEVTASVTGGGGTGSFVTETEFQSYQSFVGDFIRFTQDNLNRLDTQDDGLQSQITGLGQAINDTRDQITSAFTTAQTADSGLADVALNIERWVVMPPSYQTKTNDLWQAILSGDKSQIANAQIALFNTQALPGAGYITSSFDPVTNTPIDYGQVSTTNSFWDIIKNFFAGFGIGATGTVIAVGLILYFLFVRRNK